MQDQCNLLRTLDHWIAGTYDINAVQSAIEKWAFAERCSALPHVGGPEDEPLRQEILRRGLPIAIADRLPLSRRSVEDVLELFAKLGDEYLTQVRPSKQTTSIWDDHGVTLSGETLGDGRYALYEPPVQSGQAEIWKAIDNRSVIAAAGSGHESGSAPDRFRVVALKRPHPDDLRSASRAKAASERLLKEARRASLLEHPNICPVYFIHEGAEDESPFYTLRFLKDATLAEEIRKVHVDRQQKSLSEADVRRLIGFLAEAAAGVAYAHKQGFVHLDLKPANIAVDNINGTQVFDWGQASSITSGVASDGRASLESHESLSEATQIVLSTPAYAAPEQILRRPCSTRTDIFQLGAILYEILSGIPPYVDVSQEVTLVRSALGTPASLGDARSLPHLRSHRMKLLIVICKKAMQPDPNLRYDSVDRFRTDLLHWLNDEAIDVSPESRLQRLHRVYRKNRRSFRVGIGVLLAAVTVTAGFGAWNYFAHHHAFTAYFRSVAFGPHGVTGIWRVPEDELGYECELYRVTRKGWYGQVCRVEALGAGGVKVPWIHFDDHIDSETFVEDSESRAVDIAFEFRDGYLQSEQAKSVGGQTLWKITYTPVYSPTQRHTPVALTGMYTCFTSATAQRGAESAPLITRARLRTETVACVVHFEWNTPQHFSRVLYFDDQGCPTANSSGSFGSAFSVLPESGLAFEYFLNAEGDRHPRRDGLIYVEVVRNPKTGRILSCSEWKQSDDAESVTIAREKFFDYSPRGGPLYIREKLHGKSNGHTRVTFDIRGRASEYEFRTDDDHPQRISTYGFSGWVAEYDSSHLIRTTHIGYDSIGNGYDSIVTEYDKQGYSKTETRLYQGKETVRGISRIVTSLDTLGRFVRLEYFNSQGHPEPDESGHCTVKCEYRGDAVTYLSYEGHDEVALGYSTQRNKYDERARIISIRYLNSQGDLVGRKIDGVAEERHLYDQDSRQRHVTRVIYLDRHGSPVRCAEGCLTITAEWDGDVMTRKALVGFNATALGFYSVTEEYRSVDDTLLRQYLNEDGTPAIIFGGTATGTVDLKDEKGRLVLRRFIDMNQAQATVKEGYKQFSCKYDGDRLEEEEYEGFNAQEWGFCKSCVRYNGNSIRTERLGANDRLAKGKADGIAAWKDEYSQEGEINRTYYDEHDSKLSVITIVDRLEAGMLAATLGIVPGDVVVSYNSKAITNSLTLMTETGKNVENVDDNSVICELVIKRGEELLSFGVAPGRLGLHLKDVATVVGEAKTSSN